MLTKRKVYTAGAQPQVTGMAQHNQSLQLSVSGIPSVGARAYPGGELVLLLHVMMFERKGLDSCHRQAYIYLFRT